MLTDQKNFFLGVGGRGRTQSDTIKRNSYCNVLMKFLQQFRRRCDDGDNQRWLPVVIFNDMPEGTL